VKHTLDVIKCGLFSKNTEVANLSCRVITKIVASYNENQMQDLKFSFTEWLLVQRPKLPQAAKPLPSP